MAQRSLSGRVRNAWKRLRNLLRGEDHGGEDPYAYVTAPRKPRLPGRSAAVAVEPDR